MLAVCFTFCDHFKLILYDPEPFARVLASPFEFLALGYILNNYIKVI